MRLKPLFWMLLGGVVATAFTVGFRRPAPDVDLRVVVEPALGQEVPSSQQTNPIDDASSDAGGAILGLFDPEALGPHERALVEAFHGRYPGAFDATTEAQYRWLQARGFPTSAEFLAFREAHPRYVPLQSRHVAADPRRHLLLADLALEHLMALRESGQGMDGPDGASTEFTTALIDATTSLRHGASARAPVFAAYQHAQLESLLGSPESRDLYLGIARSCGDDRLGAMGASAGRARALPTGVRDLLLAGRDVPGCSGFGLHPFPLQGEDGRLPEPP